MIAPNDTRKPAAPKKRKPTTTSRKTSDMQVAANRRNARKSTGPKTKAGKERSRKNALKHGLFAKHLPKHEMPFLVDKAAYEEQIAQLIEDFNPTTQIEMNVIENLVMDYMRLSHIHSMELARFDRGHPPKEELDRILLHLKHAESNGTAEELEQDLDNMTAAYEAIGRGDNPELSAEQAEVVAQRLINTIESHEELFEQQTAALAKLKQSEPAAENDQAVLAMVEQKTKQLLELGDYLDRCGRKALGCGTVKQATARLVGKTKIPEKYRPGWKRATQAEITWISQQLRKIHNWQSRLDALKQGHLNQLMATMPELDKPKPYEAMVQRNIDRNLNRLRMLKHEILG